MQLGQASAKFGSCGATREPNDLLASGASQLRKWSPLSQTLVHGEKVTAYSRTVSAASSPTGAEQRAGALHRFADVAFVEFGRFENDRRNGRAGNRFDASVSGVAGVGRN